MRIFCTIFLTLVVSFTLFAQDQKINIAVLDLNGTGINEDEVQFLSNRLRTELFETGKFNVLEREQMNAILNEQGFQQSGCTSVDCAVEIGQLLNVKQMVAGSIGKIEDIYSITLRLIDVQTGAIVKTATQDHSGKLSTMLTDVIPIVAQILANDEREPVKQPVEITSAKKPVSKKNTNKGFVLSIIGGVSYFQYTNDLNNLVDNYNGIVNPDLPDYSNHSNFGFEAGYFISQNWELKIGITGNPQISNWTYKTNISSFKRSYNFTNFYIGFNSYFLTVGEKLELFAGMDIGSFVMDMISEIHASSLGNEYVEKWQDKYETSRVATKITIGAIYPIEKFRFGANMTIRLLGNPFNRPTSIYDSNRLFKIVFPREINASGIQLSLIISYDI